MRTIIVLCLASILTVACSEPADTPHTETQNHDTQYGVDSPEALVSTLRQAAEEKDRDKYLSLCCWERLAPHIQKRVKAATPLFMTNEVEFIRISKNKTDTLAELPEFKWNVNFIGNIEMKYKGKDQVYKMPYGKFENRYYLASAIKADREF